MGDPTQRRHASILAATSYVVLALAVMTDHWGRTTDDTRLELTTDPTRWLGGTFSLWNPRISLGELQNQAYGYLWPQGPFFAGGHLLGVPSWVTERAWSVLLLLLACEGLRRVALALGLAPWACLVAGLAYGLNAHVVAEIGVRSAEVVPAALLPWALLPLVLAVAGRMRQRWAAVCSAAVVGCFGGVNATVTAAPVVLLVVVVVWAVARRHLSWRFAGAWTAGLVAATAWWGTSLLLLGRYSPPFFDYVEDAPVTTGTTGFSASLRGTSNWVDYLTVAGHQWWPAGWLSAYSPGLVLAGGVVAALGVVGLLTYRGLFRAPLLAAAALGLASLVAAHTGPLDSPLAPVLQDLLDGVLAPLRNVSKADPVLRVPLCLGLAVIVGQLGARVQTVVTRGDAEPAAGRRARARRARRALLVGGAGGLVVAVVAAVLGLSYPVMSAQTRTPGWTAIPAYWQQTADYLDARSTGGATWVVPGAGFAIESWGWSLEEPIEALATSPTVTRSQVPLTPPATIRMLSSLEDYLSSGSGSPYLASMLRRIGVDRIVVRHDLDPDTSEATPAVLVSEALARSPGLRRVATFGQLAFGPAIEVFEVRTAGGAPPADHAPVSVGDVADTVTVASSVDDAQAAVGAGLVAADQPMVVAGDNPDWTRPVDVIGDRFRLRERNYGRVDQATSNVMAPGDPYRLGRTVPDYPGPPGAVRIAARYSGIAGIEASSSQGYADVIGPVLPATAPWAVLDGDPTTAWRPAPFTDPRGQWIDIDLGSPRPIGRVTLQEDRAAVGVQPVQRWQLTAGDRTVAATPDAYTGHVTADLHGVVAQHLRIEVAATADDHTPVALAAVHVQGVTPHRTLPVPVPSSARPSTDDPDYLFSARAESRACVATLLGPDCDLLRQAASEESTGIDRTITVPATGTWRVRGLVVSRSDPGTASLLQPLGGPTVTASSVLTDDPGVSARLAYDGSTTTSWLADPRDLSPTLTIDLGARRKVSTIAITPPTGIGIAPSDLVINGGGQTRTVSVNGATSRFAPLEARRLTVTLVHPGPRPPGLHPLGVAELRLGPAHLTTPLDGATPTGAVCGLGPHLVVDGRVLPTEVGGFVGAVIGNGQLAVRACGGPVALTAGEHEVRLKSTHQFQPVALELDATAASRSAPVSSRTAVQLSGTDTRRVVRVSPGDDAVLSLPQSFNVGWTAQVDGTTLTPLQVDGWAQGWRLPAGTSGDVVLTFTPQRPYVVLLAAGLALLALLLLAGLVGLVLTMLSRRRTRPGGRSRVSRHPRRLDVAPSVTVTTSRHRARPRLRRVGSALAVVVLAGLVGGPVVAAGALAGALLGGRPRLAAGAAGLLLVGAAVAVAYQQQVSPGYPWAAADLVSGAGVALALGAAATARPAGPLPVRLPGWFSGRFSGRFSGGFSGRPARSARAVRHARP